MLPFDTYIKFLYVVFVFVVYFLLFRNCHIILINSCDGYEYSIEMYFILYHLCSASVSSSFSLMEETVYIKYLALKSNSHYFYQICNNICLPMHRIHFDFVTILFNVSDLVLNLVQVRVSWITMYSTKHPWV